MSFWVVPASLDTSSPCSSASAWYMPNSHIAVALIVIEVFIVFERELVEEHAHLAEVRHRNADLADLAARERVVGVVAGLRGEVERDREAGLALRQVVAVELVRRARRGMT